MKLGPLLGKPQIRELLNAAQRALGVSTDVQVAAAIGESNSTVNSWLRRGRLPAQHRLSLMEVIRTGKPLAKDLQVKQLELCKEMLDQAWSALDPRGRAQLGADFIVWIQERRRTLQRLDIAVAKRGAGAG